MGGQLVICLIPFFSTHPPPSHPQIGTSISSLLNPPERLVGYHQPHLVCIGQPNATAQYVIVAEKDKVAIPLDNGLSFAIDKLFKIIWVCNAVYPAQLTSVFHFSSMFTTCPSPVGRELRLWTLFQRSKL